MGQTVLVVDQNPISAISVSIACMAQDEQITRTDTMCQAINLLGRQSFSAIFINADNVRFEPLLVVMRGVSTAPIFLLTSKTSAIKQADTYNLGAGTFIRFLNTPEENANAVRAALEEFSDRGEVPQEVPETFGYGRLLVTRTYHKVFLNDIELNLTKTEFDLLCFLMTRRRQVFSYAQIFAHVWGEEFSDSTRNTLWCHIKSLRKKLRAISGEDYIKTIRSVGYSFDPR